MEAVAELLRPGVLDGLRIVVVGSAEEAAASCALAVHETTRRLGADSRMERRGVPVGEGVDVAIVDGASLFAAGGLHDCLAGAWDATHAAANEAFLPAERGGRIVYLAPAPAAGEHSDAARAGLENLARTLSIEWARHGITTVTIALGDQTLPGEAAALTAYLASPAGAYFSGCQLDLRGP